MTTYYVRKTGSDSAAGTSTGTAWLTVGKAVGGSVMASGDTCYVGAGVYRETPTLTLAPTATTSFIADVDGTNTGDAGEVVLTAFLTNDKTAPSANTILTNTSNRNFYLWQGFTFVTGAANGGLYSDSAGGHDWSFLDCTINGLLTNTAILLVSPAAQAVNLLVDRCRFFARIANTNAGLISLQFTRPSGADFNHNIVIQNSLFTGGGAQNIRISTTGANTFKPGGVTVQGCTFYAQIPVQISDANFATSLPCNVNNCLIFGNTGLQATSLGQIVEDYNLIYANTARTTVSVGAHSVSDGSYAPLISLGQEYAWGGPPVAPFSPSNNPSEVSPIAGFGVGISPSTYDLLNRPRPSGGASTSIAVGALEIHDFATREASVIDASTYAMKLTGPGDQEIVIPVDAVAQVISIRSRHDANHGDTNKPQALLLSNGEIGVAAQTVTATQTSGNWETLTFSSITPTAKSWVTLRLISRSAAGNGIAYFDTVAVV